MNCFYWATTSQVAFLQALWKAISCSACLAVRCPFKKAPSLHSLGDVRTVKDSSLSSLNNQRQWSWLSRGLRVRLSLQKPGKNTPRWNEPEASSRYGLKRKLLRWRLMWKSRQKHQQTFSKQLDARALLVWASRAVTNLAAVFSSVF